MSPRFKGQWRPSLFKLMLMIGAFLFILFTLVQPKIEALKGKETRNESHKQEDDIDPMEPCYLANNRASESLTISESTPVGTVVGELLVSISIRLLNVYIFV